MAQRIAVASSTGNMIDLHFAQADVFRIYDVEEQGYAFVETRKGAAATGHDVTVFEGIAETLKDCSGIFVQQIGQGATRFLNSKGFRVFEAPYSVKDVMEKLVADGILFKENK